MKPRASILVSLFAGLVSLVGLVLTIGALSAVKSSEELRRLLSYDYVSFVDGQVVGGMATDFFIGIATLLIGSVLCMKVDSLRRVGRVTAGVLLLFISLTLVYACLNPRIGVRPY
ncbi:MAG TPA: hypothetical protein VHC91_14560 [Trinickia sp.]|uniref:hypothetical protein n=1 Tax=Trinickia sp. TaxID=2571163 RepID=UPI002B726CDC|nr:hypothetical protein [Trinickia sp.]HVW51596.1 hypothetical protein [Trinickia sp.]